MRQDRSDRDHEEGREEQPSEIAQLPGPEGGEVGDEEVIIQQPHKDAQQDGRMSKGALADPEALSCLLYTSDAADE